MIKKVNRYKIMENNKLQNGINEVKSIKMTNDEKKIMLQNILKSTQTKTSPWVSYSFMAILQRNKFVYYMILPLIFILSGGGVVFASQDSLPNSILYPIKVKVLEPIEGVLISSPISKAKHESNLAKERLVEAEVLANQGKLDLQTEKKINTLISGHTKALNKVLDQINTTSKEIDTSEITTNFRAEMNAHAKILDIIKNKYDRKENKDIKNNGNVNNINTDNNLKYNNSDIDANISSRARFSANKIKDVQDHQDLKNVDNYKKRKDTIEKLINKINTDIIDPTKDNKNSVADDTAQTLDEAKKSFEYANSKNKEGDSKEAYKSLLDSESSIKEANILIESYYKSEDKSKGDGKKDN